MTEMIDFGKFASFYLERPSVITSVHYACIFMMRINQVQVCINYDIKCLPKRTLAKIVYHQLQML